MPAPGQAMRKPGDLAALMADPGVDDDGSQTLVIDLRPGAFTDFTARQTADTVAWLRSGSRIVIGVTDDTEPAGPLDAGMDLLLTADQLDACTHAIRSNPLAAQVLVEVLRTTEHLLPADALIVESLAYATLQGGPEHRAWLEAERQRRPARVLPHRDDLVVLERARDRLHIRLNSPETRNALSAVMRDALTDAFTLAAVDTSITVVEVSGAGPCFCAGGDLKEFGLTPDPATAHRIRLQRMPARYLLRRSDVYRFRLHGACIGAGIELPAFAGHVAARADSRFRLPEVAMGLIPGAGGCVSIPRRIGRQRTAFLALSGKEIDADLALAWGLVDAVET
jgi:enoyl-CoA hydratase